MEDDLSLHLQSVWQSSKIGFYCLNAAASAELVEFFFAGLRVRGKTLCIMPSSTTECGKLEPVSGIASGESRST